MDTRKRFDGFTYLRAIFSWIIVSWHGHFLGQTPAMKIADSYSANLQDIYQCNIMQMGVPIFITISLFLFIGRYYSNSSKGIATGAYLKKRLLNFLALYVFWRVIYFLFGIGQFWHAPRGLFRNVYHLIFGSDTVLYYFVEMLWLLIGVYLMCKFTVKLSSRQKLYIYSLLSIVSMMITTSLYFLPLGLKIESLRYFSPIGFIPYLFSSLLIHHLYTNYQKHCNKIMIALTLVSIAFIISEWMLLPDKVYLENGIASALTGYGRPSLVTSSMALMLLVLNVRKNPPAIIENLGNISLYVFCLHPIFIRVFGGLPHGWFIVAVVCATLVCSELLYLLKTKTALGKSKIIGNIL